MQSAVNLQTGAVQQAHSGTATRRESRRLYEGKETGAAYRIATVTVQQRRAYP